MTASLKVCVFGAGGLAGGELLRLLLLHPHVGAITAQSRSRAGRPVHEVHRALRHLRPLSFKNLPLKEAVAAADVVFLALPHGESMSCMPELVALDPPCIVDLGGDFRLDDEEAFNLAYGEHSCFDLVESFTYGLPELFREQIKCSRRIANPGCFATAAELLLLPLAAKGLLPVRSGIFAVTGSSGSGILPKPGTHHPHRDGNFWAYKLLAHQHEPEITRILNSAGGSVVSPRLLPHSGPFVRGIHATSYFDREELKDLDLVQLYREYYLEQPFVEVIDDAVQVAEVAGSNYVHINLCVRGSELVLTLALDNLVKGAAGQAIQNMNLALGLPETAGLQHPGAFPC